MASLPIAAVLASTGTQGLSVAKALSQSGYHVRALTRSPTSPKTISAFSGLSNVEPFFFDIEDLSSVEKAFTGTVLVFAVTIPYPAVVFGKPGTVQEKGLDEVQQGKMIADVVKKVGVPLSIWSSVPNSNNMRAKYPDQLQRNAKSITSRYTIEQGIPAVFLDMGFFNDNLISYKRATLNSEGSVIYSLGHAGSHQTYPHVSVSHDLGKVVSLIATNFENFNKDLNHKHLAMIDRYYSLDEILRTIEKVTGRPTILQSLPVIGEPGSVYDNMFKSLADPSVSYFDPEVPIPDPTLLKMGFKFQTFDEFVKKDLVPYLEREEKEMRA